MLETIYFEGCCTSKEVEKVLKVKLSSGEVSLVVLRMTCCEVQVVRRQFWASGRPDDHLICTLHVWLSLKQTWVIIQGKYV